VKFGAKQLAILLLALVFLFETWVWGSMVAAARVVAAFIPWTRFQIWARGVVNKLQAIVAVLLFGVPLFVSEFGAFISVVLMATGHLLIGSAMYIALEIVGVSLIGGPDRDPAAIGDLLDIRQQCDFSLHRTKHELGWFFVLPCYEPLFMSFAARRLDLSTSRRPPEGWSARTRAAIGASHGAAPCFPCCAAGSRVAAQAARNRRMRWSQKGEMRNFPPCKPLKRPETWKLSRQTKTVAGATCEAPVMNPSSRAKRSDPD
jgi:hypothetical protein